MIGGFFENNLRPNTWLDKRRFAKTDSPQMANGMNYMVSLSSVHNVRFCYASHRMFAYYVNTVSLHI